MVILTKYELLVEKLFIELHTLARSFEVELFLGLEVLEDAFSTIERHGDILVGLSGLDLQIGTSTDVE